MLITSGSQRVKCVHRFKSSNFIKSLICSIIINLTFEILIIIIIISILVFTKPVIAFKLLYSSVVRKSY